mmetsp:Transcript_8561/g.24417  ORF Transcript_8561/g.24417 Transcript_8561/m.24417 type:complete len:456 (+) Transcript_8561:59-1426(+)
MVIASAVHSARLERLDSFDRTSSKKLDINVRIVCELVKSLARLVEGPRVEARGNLLQALGHAEADVGHVVLGHLNDQVDEPLVEERGLVGGRQHLDGAQRGHPVEVVGVLLELNDTGDNVFLRPGLAKGLGELLKVVGGGLANRVHLVCEPSHTQVREGVLEEGLAELLREKRHVLDDGEANAPLAVIGEAHNGRQQGLGQHVDANDLVELAHVGDDVEAHLRLLVLEEGEEEREQVLHGGLLADERREAHDDLRQRRAHVLARVAGELLHGGEELLEDGLLLEALGDLRDAAAGDRADLGLGVCKELDVDRGEVTGGEVLAESVADLVELVRDGPAHPPGLVRGEGKDDGEDLLLGDAVVDELGEDDGVVDAEEAHAVLVLSREERKERQQLVAYRVLLGVLSGADLGKLAEVVGRGAAHHGRVVAAELAEHAAELGLVRVGDARVGDGEERAG